LADEGFLFSEGWMEEKAVKIRRATVKDVPAVVPLWQEMMDFHAALDAWRFRPAEDGASYWAEAVAGWLKDENCCAFVADAGDRLVGYIIGWVRQPVPIFQPGVYGLVSDMCVAADCRRRGIGRRLFEALKAWFRERGASHVSLRVAVTNPVSQAFWRSVGCEDYMDDMWYTL
jgi:ribosomal protein S18 acetylase RimI-like enzyme